MSSVLHNAKGGYWSGTGDALKSAGGAFQKEGVGAAFMSLLKSRPELVSGFLMALFGGMLGLTRRGGSRMGNMAGPAALLGGLGIGGGLLYKNRNSIADEFDRLLARSTKTTAERGIRHRGPGPKSDLFVENLSGVANKGFDAARAATGAGGYLASAAPKLPGYNATARIWNPIIDQLKRRLASQAAPRTTPQTKSGPRMALPELPHQ